MALINWGWLPKSQFDIETIEEAIARLIAAHNDDETAHLEVGQSLQSHKASEIIDHLAASIVTDKLADKQVTVYKLGIDKMWLTPTFESLDGWLKTAVGTGAYVQASVGIVTLRGGTVNGNSSTLYNESASFPVGHDRSPFFQFWFLAQTDTVSYCDFEMSVFHQFGFKFIQSSGKFYAFYYDSNLAEDVFFEIINPTLDYRHLYRAELLWDPTQPVGQRATINYYIDNVLVKTFANVDVDIDYDNFVFFGITTRGGGGEFDIYVSNLIFGQD